MFTLFNLLEMVVAMAGLLLGAVEGNRHVGIPGAVFGAVIGACVGLICGRLPGVLSEWAVKKSIQRKSSAQLRQELLGERCYLFHLFLAVLMMRGEDIQQEADCVVKLLKSENQDKRRMGWANLQLVYPDLAEKISGYRWEAPWDVCQNMADSIARTD